MIVQFSIENFLSFKGRSILSLVATPLRENQTLTENVLIPITDTEVSLLKSAVILGPNASGKSNVIKAFDFCKRFIIGSFKDDFPGTSPAKAESATAVFQLAEKLKSFMD